MEWTDILKGGRGSKMITGTGTNAGSFGFFVVNTDAVIDELLDENGDSVLSDQNLSGNTVSKTIVIIPQGHANFSSIKLASGTVMAYLK